MCVAFTCAPLGAKGDRAQPIVNLVESEEGLLHRERRADNGWTEKPIQTWKTCEIRELHTCYFNFNLVILNLFPLMRIHIDTQSTVNTMVTI